MCICRSPCKHFGTVKTNLQLVLELFLCRYRKINTLLFCIAFSANCFQTKQQSCVQEVKLSCGGSVCTKELKKKKNVSNEMPWADFARRLHLKSWLFVTEEVDNEAVYSHHDMRDVPSLCWGSALTQTTFRLSWWWQKFYTFGILLVPTHKVQSDMLYKMNVFICCLTTSRAPDVFGTLTWVSAV